MSVSKAQERLGQRFINNQGYEFVIVEYNSYGDVWVEFQDEHKARVHTRYGCCQSGSIRNPYHPSVCGVGYLGERVKISVDDKLTREYDLWHAMIQRCYGSKSKCSTYKDVTVCDEWLCFANFLEDLPLIDGYEMWLNHQNQGISLDKDIKQVGVEHKVYSLETVKFVTKSENVKEMHERMNQDYKKVKVICLETKQIFKRIRNQ